MRSFLLLKNLGSCLSFLQSYELLIFVVYTLNQFAIIKKIWQKREEVSTEGNHSTRHPNVLVRLVTLGLILIIKFDKSLIVICLQLLLIYFRLISLPRGLC